MNLSPLKACPGPYPHRTGDIIRMAIDVNSSNIDDDILILRDLPNPATY